MSNDQKHHDEAIWTMSSSDNSILTGSLDETVKLWSLIGDELTLKELKKEHGLAITSVDISLDGKIGCSIGLDNQLVIYDLINLVTLKKLDLVNLTSYKLKLSPQSTHLVVCGQNGTILIYSVPDLLLVSTISIQTDSFIMSITYSNDGQYLAVGTDLGEVYILVIQSKSVYRKFISGNQPIRSIVYSKDDTKLMVGQDDGKIIVYNPHHQTILSTLTGHKGWINTLLMVNDLSVGSLLISGSSDTSVKLWSLDTMSLMATINLDIKELPSHQYQVWSLSRIALPRTNPYLIIGLESGEILIKDQPSLKLK